MYCMHKYKCDLWWKVIMEMYSWYVQKGKKVFTVVSHQLCKFYLINDERGL